MDAADIKTNKILAKEQTGMFSLKDSPRLSSPRRSGRLQSRQNDMRRSSTSSTISVEVISPKRQTRSSQAANRKDYTSSTNVSEKTSPLRRRTLDIGEPEFSDEEGDIVATRPAQRRRGRGSNHTEAVFVVEDDEVDDEFTSEEEPPIRRTQHSRRRRNTPSSKTQSGSESDAALTTSSKRKRASTSTYPTKSPRTVRHKNRQEAQEIAEDLEDLRDSSSLQRTRTRGKPITTKQDRQRKMLDRLKRKRAGELSDSTELDGDDALDGEEEYDIEDVKAFQGLEDASNPIEILSGSKASSSAASKSARGQRQYSKKSDLDDYDKDFIVSDPEEDLLGAPTASLPFQFSHHASARPREYFRYVVEWLVKNKTAPAFSRDDEIYDVAFKKIDDEVQGQAGSRYRSAAWTREFVTVLDARPQFHIVEFDGSDVVCDACHRTNHPATWEVTLTGEAYDKSTLEPIDVDEDEGDGEGEDATSSEIEYDAKGNLLPPSTQAFYLGRYCAFNAEMTHKLSHWKWHLNDWLLDLLEWQGMLDAEAIVARDRLSQRRKEAEAERVVDAMEEDGQMERLWGDFKADKERAREGMEDSGGRQRQSGLLRGKWQGKGRHGGGLSMFARS